MNQNQPVPPAPEETAITCPCCTTASMLKDVSKIAAWFSLVKKVLESSDEVKDFLSKNN
jgi:hypothetical protein